MYGLFCSGPSQPFVFIWASAKSLFKLLHSDGPTLFLAENNLQILCKNSDFGRMLTARYFLCNRSNLMRPQILLLSGQILFWGLILSGQAPELKFLRHVEMHKFIHTPKMALPVPLGQQKTQITF